MPLTRFLRDEIDPLQPEPSRAGCDTRGRIIPRRGADLIDDLLPAQLSADPHDAGRH